MSKSVQNLKINDIENVKTICENVENFKKRRCRIYENNV
jgi:hypothetical protein